MLRFGLVIYLFIVWFSVKNIFRDCNKPSQFLKQRRRLINIILKLLFGHLS